MDKPIPRPNADSQPYWDGCNRGELLFQHCLGCDSSQFYPRALCARCRSTRLEWRRSAGTGSIYSFTEIQRAPTPAFEAPYVVALVELDEGFRLVTNLRGGTEGLCIGARGRIGFEARGPQQVPIFELDR